MPRQRELVDAFFAAARGGDFEALVAVLDPDVVLHADGGPGSRLVVRGAGDVARRALLFADPTSLLRPVLVNGACGVVATRDGEPVAVMAFTVAAGRIVAIDTLSDLERVAALDLA